MKFLLCFALLTSSLFGAEALVKVYTSTERDSWSATAFAVSPDLLVTAAHTFEHTAKKNMGQTFVLHNGAREPARIVKIDYALDVCVLKTSYLSDDACYVLTNGQAGDAVFLTGFKSHLNTNRPLRQKEKVRRGRLFRCHGRVRGAAAGDVGCRDRYVRQGRRPENLLCAC